MGRKTFNCCEVWTTGRSFVKSIAGRCGTTGLAAGGIGKVSPNGSMRKARVAGVNPSCKKVHPSLSTRPSDAFLHTSRPVSVSKLKGRYLLTFAAYECRPFDRPGVL